MRQRRKPRISRWLMQAGNGLDGTSLKRVLHSAKPQTTISHAGRSKMAYHAFMMKIDADIPVEDLVEKHPHAVRILSEFNIVCIRCGEPYWGTLGELAADKGVTDLEPVLNALREGIVSAS